MEGPGSHLYFERMVSGCCVQNRLNGANRGSRETSGDMMAMLRGGSRWTSMAAGEWLRELGSTYVLKEDH